MPTLVALTSYAGGSETGPLIWLNADRIITMKRLPGYVKGTHTVIELTDGIKLDVHETPEQVLEAVVKSASAKWSATELHPAAVRSQYVEMFGVPPDNSSSVRLVR